MDRYFVWGIFLFLLVIKLNKNKKIFICCTEQSGDNIVYNICKKLKKYNYQIDGVCGKTTEKFFTNKYYDISLFKSLGLFEIILSLPKILGIINKLTFKILGERGHTDLIAPYTVLGIS